MRFEIALHRCSARTIEGSVAVESAAIAGGEPRPEEDRGLGNLIQEKAPHEH